MHEEITIIIPTYKPAEYIERCIESVVQQTLSKEKYEVIVVLNGCRDPYYNKLSSLLNASGLHVQIYHTETKGVSNARNIALDKAQGKYIVFLDDDDWLSDNFLENLLCNAVDDGIIQTNVRMIDDVTHEETEHYVSKAYIKNSQRRRLNVVNSRSFFSSAWGKLIPRKIIGDVSFDTSLSNGEDALFMFTISKEIKTIRLASIDTIYYVRQRVGSASRVQFNYFYRWRLASKIIWKYTRIFLFNVFKYNGIFFLTRIAATVRRYLI